MDQILFRDLQEPQKDYFLCDPCFAWDVHWANLCLVSSLDNCIVLVHHKGKRTLDLTHSNVVDVTCTGGSRSRQCH